MKLLHSELRLGEVVVKLKTEQADLVASVDEIQIQQVLMNLIRNAVDAMSETPPRQRILTISNSRTADDMIEIAVSDTGTGISNEAIGQIFDTFFTTKPDGMGLGLAISKTIIGAHEGKLWATPNSERGVTFHFSLPAAKQQSNGQAQSVR